MLKLTPRCRLCLNTSSGTGVDLFLDSNGLIYSDQIREELGIELEEVPEWPREACLTCIVVLQKISRFRGFVIENEHKLRIEYCTAEPEEPPEEEIEQPYTDDHEEGVFGMILEEEVLEEVDIEIDIIDSDADETESHDNLPPRDTPVDADILLPPSETPDGPYAPLPVVTAAGQQGDLFSEIIAYESESEVTVVSTGPSINSPSINPPNEIPLDTTPYKARSKKPDKVSVVRLSSYVLTEEEEELETQMVEMGLFVCKVCGLDCKTFYQLREHVNTVHDFKNYEFCCNQRVGISLLHLYDHIRWHLKSDSLKCKICHHLYTHSTALAQHMARKHYTELPSFVCEFCGKGFFTNQLLTQHAEVHEWVFCKYCGRDFAPRSLALHIKSSHQSDVPFANLCEICGEGFSNQSRLRMHILDHGGQYGRQTNGKL